MRVSVLGPLAVELDDVAVDLGPVRARTLLAVLVAAARRPVAVEQLIDELWGEHPPAKALGSLQVHISNLRRVLEPDRAPRTRPSRLVTRPPGYALLGAEVDAEQFAADAARGRALRDVDPHAAGEILDAALSSWRGEAYAGLTGTSALLRAEATRLDEIRLAALEDRWQTRLDTGEDAAVVGDLEVHVAQQPLRERGWGLLALALYRAQRQGDALAALRRARAVLADELGVDPSSQLRDLEAAILAHDVAPPLHAPDRAHRDTPTSVLPAAMDVPLGRHDALGALAETLAALRRGQGRLVLVTGEPGIGKTTLVASAARSATGVTVGWGRWHEEGGANAFSAWSAALDQLGAPGVEEHLTPLLRDRREGAATSNGIDVESAGLRLAEAVHALLAALTAERPVLLVLEDLQWADADSLRLLRRVAGTVHATGAVLVVTTRTVEADLTTDVIDTLGVLARCDPVRIALCGLSCDDLDALARARLGRALEPDAVAAVHERTDGNPFHAGELLRLLAADGHDITADAVRSLQVPDGVRDVVRRRLGALPEDTRSVLAVCAVAGRRFPLDIVEDVLDLDQSVVDGALDLALLHDLIRPDTAAGQLQFSHALVREVVYGLVPPRRRARLHALVAQSLEQQRIGRIDAHLTELAEHYRLAGHGHARDCWTYAGRAASAAAGHGALAEAARLYELALDMIAADTHATTQEVLHLHTEMGRTRLLQANTREAWEHLELAGKAALALDDAATAARAVLIVTEGMPWTWRDNQGYAPDAVELWEQILHRLPVDEHALRARVTAALGAELLHEPRRTARNADLADQAVQLAQVHCDDEDLLQVLGSAHIALEQPDLVPRRTAVAEQMVQVAERLADPAAIAHALLDRAADVAVSGRFTAARADAARAHRIATEQRLVPLLLVAGWMDALWLQVTGEFAAAAQSLERMATLHRSVSMTGEGIALVQRASLCLLQGRLDAMQDQLAAVADRSAGLRDVHLTALLQGRGPAEARRAAGPWEAQPELPFDYLYLCTMTLRARLWAMLEDPRAIEDLRRTLTPYAGQWATGGSSVFFDGIVDETLGVLACAAGDHTEGIAYLRTAVDAYAAHGMRPFQARATAALQQAFDAMGALPAEAAPPIRRTGPEGEWAILGSNQ